MFTLKPQSPPEPELDESEVLPAFRPNAQLNSWNIRLYCWTRNLWLLTAVAASILIIAAGIAWSVRKQADDDGGEDDEFAEGVDSLEDALAGGDRAIETICRAIWFESLDATQTGAQSVVDIVQRSGMSPANKELVSAYWLTLAAHAGEPNASMLIMAYHPAPIPKANELVAGVYLSGKNMEKAKFYLEREEAVHSTPELRKKMVRLAVVKKDSDWLRKLSKDPRFDDVVTLPERLQLAILDRDWNRIIPHVAALEMRSIGGPSLWLALITGLVWCTILIQAVQPPAAICFRTLILIPALFSGALSTFPTLLVSIWQESAWGLNEYGDFIARVKFFILGVGLREETIKFVFFLPFVPILKARDSRLEAIIVASAVGLGFAVQEDLQYIQMGGGMTAITRVLTANLFHLTATGLIGFSFCESLREPNSQWWRFPLVFCTVVLAHGIYDIFAMLPQAPWVTACTMTVFLVLAMFYFRRLRGLRQDVTDQFSMGCTVVLGITMVASVAFIIASQQGGFADAASVLGVQVFMYVMVGYLFHWQLGEGMSHAYAEELQQWNPRY